KPGFVQRIRNSWVPIPAGVGVTLLAILQWRRLQKERNKDSLKVAKEWEITCYRALPLRSLSRVFGWASETYIPVTFRPYVYTSYARVFGVNLDEMSETLDFYNCFGTFFTRRLKEGVRPVDLKKCIVSPADGTVLNAGKLKSFNIEQVKGVTYSIKTFLGDITWNKNSVDHHEDTSVNAQYRKDAGLRSESWREYKNRLVHNTKNELYQCIVYLAPGDYHRFHSPVDWNVTFRRHFQGELLSVSPRFAKWIPNLFSLNERAVYVGTWEHGYFSMTAVGATNVGSIRVFSDKTLHTNTSKWKDTTHRDCALNCNWFKGEEIGEFRMGSTLVIIFEAPPNFKLNLSPGARVKVGEAMCDESADNPFLSI
ncbi:hypothetical protein AAG570_005038, partial [Ranatra chinensis]